jgi:phosphoribosylformimino-5-aminoimidazole carboxamide ribotide isomerase
MLIYPAIDLMEGRCVRLSQGRFDAPTVYSADPAEALAGFAEGGATWAHVVDLEGARAREPRQHDLIAGLAANGGPRLQVAGGFRSRDQVARMLDAGLGRVVIGSLAVAAPDQVAAWLVEFGPDRITLAFDVRLIEGTPIIATSGWLETSGSNLWEAASFYPQARHVLVTDISRDGMMGGPNVALTDELVRRIPRLEVQASGGVASLEDLRALSKSGAAGAIVGKALWEGRFGLAEAIAAGRRSGFEAGGMPAGPESATEKEAGA